MAQLEHGVNELVPLNTLLVPVALARAFGLPGFADTVVLAPVPAPLRTDSRPRSQQQKSNRSLGQPATSGQKHTQAGDLIGAHQRARAAEQAMPSTTQTTGFGALELSSMNPPPQTQHVPRVSGGSGPEPMQPAQTTATAPMPETSYQQMCNGQDMPGRSMSTGMPYPQGMQYTGMQYPYNPQQLMAAAQAQAYHTMQQIGSSGAMSYGSQGPGMPYAPYPGYPMMGGYSMMDYAAQGYRNMGMGPMSMCAATSVTTEEEEDGAGGARAVKRPRLVWTPQLHKRFEEAINKLGWDKAVPKNIMQEMNVEGLTRENVASHLQKYRLQMQMKKGSDDGKADDALPLAHSSPQTGATSHGPAPS